eukprot:3939688-Rhodomonas_salina.1
MTGDDEADIRCASCVFRAVSGPASRGNAEPQRRLYPGRSLPRASNQGMPMLKFSHRQIALHSDRANLSFLGNGFYSICTTGQELASRRQGLTDCSWDYLMVCWFVEGCASSFCWLMCFLIFFFGKAASGMGNE